MKSLSKNSIKIIGIVVLIIVGASIYFYSSKNSPVVKGPQALAIENKGLAEFNAENDTANNVSSQDKKLAEEMMPIFKEMGDGKDNAKNKEAVVALGKIITKHSEYSDAYLLRATISVLVGDKDYQKILSDIDNAIKFHSSSKYKSSYDSTAGMYSLRAKVDILSANYQEAVSDLETAIKIDPSNTNSIFNTGGVKPEDESNPTALQKKDFDLLVSKYLEDYRVYVFRSLFFSAFTTFDEKYYSTALADLKQALKLKPDSDLVNYFVGELYSKMAYWTKDAWSDVSNMFGSGGGYRDKTNTTALGYYLETVKINPNFKLALSKIASILAGLKRHTEAINYYDRVVELDPNDTGALNDRGLSKVEINNYYGAISDFSDAIRLAEQSEKSHQLFGDAYRDLRFKNRADAYVKVGSYDEAVADYSRAIGIEFASQVLLMNLSQIRAVYPEFQSISDQDLIEGLRQKYNPNLSSEDFAKSLKENKDHLGGTSLADNYISRADTLLKKGEFNKATVEYARAPKVNRLYSDNLTNDRWKTISKTLDTEYAVDVLTLDFGQNGVASVWVKITDLGNNSYFQSNFQINCQEKKIKSVSSTRYNSLGNIIGNIPAQNWEVVSPATIGEILYKGMCK